MTAQVKVHSREQHEIEGATFAKVDEGHLYVYAGKDELVAVYAPGKWEAICFDDVAVTKDGPGRRRVTVLR